MDVYVIMLGNKVLEEKWKCICFLLHLTTLCSISLFSMSLLDEIFFHFGSGWLGNSEPVNSIHWVPHVFVI